MSPEINIQKWTFYSGWVECRILRSVFRIIGTGLILIFLIGCQAEPAKPKRFQIGIVNLAEELVDAANGFKTVMNDLMDSDGFQVEYTYVGPREEGPEFDSSLEDLIEKKPDLIFSITTPATLKVKRAVGERNIPIAFCQVTDPVGDGIVSSLREPGGNVTGIQSRGAEAKGLDWLRRIMPDLSCMYVLYKADDRSMSTNLPKLRKAAAARGIELLISMVITHQDIIDALANVPDKAQVIWQLPSGFWWRYTEEFIQAARKHRIPLRTHSYHWVEKGAFFSYGTVDEAVGKQAARLAYKILFGTPPAVLPVEQGENIVGLNLKTAKELGLVIPASVLKQADFIVR